ncbi:MAG: hypothetical protein WCP41_05065 [Verrucomicrobiota bacterium]
MNGQRLIRLAAKGGFLRYTCLSAVMLISLTLTLRAQLLVDFSLQRNLYIAYEPLLATVRITNLSGGNLLLADVEGKKWFGFQIETLDGRPIPPIDPNYEIEPVQIGAGESITRTVNLTPLYPLGDYGSYRVRATVYAAELGGYFSSPPMTVEITEGRMLWQQVVGVPGMGQGRGSERTITLLAQRLPDKTDLYLRIQDKNAGIVYCTSRLGDFISYGKPQVLLDSTNSIHILQNSAPRLFVYSKVGLDGKILSRISYNAPKTRPTLARSADGTISVFGGIPFDPHATPPPFQIAKLSDRPVPLPTPEAAPTPPSKGKKTQKTKPTPSPKQSPPQSARPTD